VYQQPLYVPSKAGVKYLPLQKNKQTEGRKKKKKYKEKITRKETYQKYLYIQSAN